MALMAREIIHDETGAISRDAWYDLDRKWFTLTVYGTTVEDRPMTTAEWLAYGPQPLPTDGVIATLNVVLGLWTLQDAANASGYTEEQLVAEAQAWAAAEGSNP